MYIVGLHSGALGVHVVGMSSTGVHSVGVHVIEMPYVWCQACVCMKRKVSRDFSSLFLSNKLLLAL